MRAALLVLVMIASLSCVLRPAREELVVQWYCEHPQRDGGVQIARAQGVALYQCRPSARAAFLGTRDAGCAVEDAFELRVSELAEGEGAFWVGEYLVPACRTGEHDWNLGKDLLERADAGLRALRSITY
jgi:hypothetical protein